MKKFRIPTLLGLGLILVGVIGGVFLVQRVNTLNTKAFDNIKPQNINTSNITNSSFIVSWTTPTPTTGYIKWGTQPNSLNNIAIIDDERRYTHYIEVTGLDDSTKYFYKIYTNSNEISNNNDPFFLTTGRQISPKPVTELASGKIITNTGMEVVNAIVYINIKGGNTLSDTTTQNGDWIIPLSNMRLKDLSNYLKFDEEDLIDIFIDAGPLGTATAKISAVKANPIPPIELGEFSDFTDDSFEFNDEIPDSTLNGNQPDVQSSFDFLFD